MTMRPLETNTDQDLAALRRENQSLRAELNFLQNSLRMRAASLLAEAFSSPRAALAAPARLWAFFHELRATKHWRRIVLGLECGLPNDCLRLMSAGTTDSRRLRKMADAVLAGRLIKPHEASVETPSIAAAIHRSAELDDLAANGPVWPDIASPGATPAASRKVVMALHACEADILNGYTRRSHELMRALGERGWDIRGAVRGEGATCTTHDGCNYKRIGEPAATAQGYESYVAAYAGRLLDFIHEEKPALVHAASNHVTGRAAAIAARRAGLPFIYEVRGLWEVTRISIEPSYEASIGFRAQRRLEIETARQADRLLVNGEAIAALFAEAGVDKSKIVIAPNGCNAEAFHTDPSYLKALKERWGLNDHPVIGFVGSLTPYEGLEDLFTALARLTETPYQGLIVGDGPARAQLEQKAIKLGLADRICWTGRVSPEDAHASYGLIDIAPLVRSDTPVTRLTPPLKPLEAMAAGSALIVSDLAPLREFAQGGRGLTVRPNDAKALRTALQSLLDSPQTRKSMTDAAQRWVRSERRWADVAQIVAASYEAVLR